MELSGACRAALAKQVAQHLRDAPALGHHRRQAGGKVEGDGVSPAAAEERSPRLLHQIAELRGLGRDRERARVEAPGVEQVADEAAHVVGLLVDDAQERAKLGRVHRLRGVEHGGDRALDGGERGAQLVAHQAQELGAQPLDLVERGQVLHGHHHRRHRAVLGMDGRRVDQHPHAAPVRHRERDLLGAHRLAGAQILSEGELAKRYLASVRAAEGEHLQEILGPASGHPQPLHDAPRLAVERDRPAALRVEHHDAHRGGLDQRLEIGARAALVAVGARVGDRRGGLGGEQHQRLLVLAGERLAVRLVGEEEAADAGAAVAHRRALEAAGEGRGGLDAERADVARQIVDPQRPVQGAEVREQPRAVGPGVELALLLRREAREHEVERRAGLVDGGDDAPARAGERAGALHDLAQHGVEVEARVDPEHRVGQRRAARPRGFVVSPVVFRTRHGSSLAESARRPKGRPIRGWTGCVRRLRGVFFLIFTEILPKRGIFARTFYIALCTFGQARGEPCPVPAGVARAWSVGRRHMAAERGNSLTVRNLSGCTIKSARAPERQSARAPERQSARAPERQSARAPERHDCAHSARRGPGRILRRVVPALRTLRIPPPEPRPA